MNVERVIGRRTAWWVAAIACWACSSSGSHHPDAGPPLVDAGHGPVDAGSPSPDSGAPADAGLGPIDGTWVGTLTLGPATTPIQFAVHADGGAVSGLLTLFDPNTNAPILAGPIQGQIQGAAATWTTYGGGLIVSGDFGNGTFSGSGTFVLPPDAGTLPTTTVSLHLVDGGP